MIPSLLVFLAPAVGVVRAAQRLLEVEKTAGLAELPVPRDRVLASRFAFRPPSPGDVREAFEIGHAVSEVFHTGDAFWDSPGEFPSLVRNTSNRVIGYVHGFRSTGRDIYRARVLDGLDYLLRVQCDDGDFPWFYRSNRGVRNRDDGLFETGIAGRAFVKGFRLTGDARFLDASERAARWEIECPVSDKNNYNMFAVWHLAAHYALTGESWALDAAVEKTRLGGIPNQLDSGGWPGHNSWMWYHGIIVRGMAELARVLPEGHSFREELMASLTAAVNRAVREQTRSGEIPPNPGVRLRGHTCPFILSGLVTARSLFGDALDTCLRGLMRFRLRKAPDLAFVGALERVWRDYEAARRSARRAATGEVVWAAAFDRFVDDPVWGRRTPDVFACWYPCNDLDPTHHRWDETRSVSSGGAAQRIFSSGARLLGGMGWSIPRGVLTPGRRYRFTARVRGSGTPQSLPLVLCSAYAGRSRPEWDPFTGCEFTRENPSFGSFSEVSTRFVAAARTNRVYTWAMSSDIGESDMVGIEVDSAWITDAGKPLPQWDRSLDRFDSQPDMLLLPVGMYMEEMSGRVRPRAACR